jgi:hypothetical protein
LDAKIAPQGVIIASEFTVIANVGGRAHDRQLKTNTIWWEMHGGRIRSAFNWLAENKTIAFVASVASIIGLVIAIYALQ